MIFAVCFTNLGPYHLARLRALAGRLREHGDGLIAYEVAATERTYPWQRRSSLSYSTGLLFSLTRFLKL